MCWFHILVQSLFYAGDQHEAEVPLAFLTLTFFLHNAAATARATFEIFPARTT